MFYWIVISALLFARCNPQTGQNITAQADSALVDDRQKQETTQSMSDFEPVPLDRLIGLADLIAYGTITGLDDTVYTFTIDQRLAGEAPGRDIRVKQYHPDRFEGGDRPSPYAAGQSYLLFLKRVPGETFKIMGFAGEGELPVAGGHVYFVRRNVEILPRQEFQIFGARQAAQRYPLEAFLTAIKGYTNCFKWQNGKPAPAKGIDEIKKYAAGNEMQKYLAGLTPL